MIFFFIDGAVQGGGKIDHVEKVRVLALNAYKAKLPL